MVNSLTHNIQTPDPKDTRPLYRKVESYIESLVHSGGLLPGEAIPSHAQLAKTLGVNNLTVKRAIRELVFKRVLISLQGRGTFVAEGGVKRLLWVTEIDLFGGDTSSYYGDLFKLAVQECEKHGLRLEPVWLPKDRPFDMAVNANGGEAAILGYLFSGCDEQHELLVHVKDSGRPYINLSANHWGKPRGVLPNFPQGYRMGLECIRKQGFERAMVFNISKTRDELLRTDASLPKVQFITQQPIESQAAFERNSYQATRYLYQAGELERALFIMDDIVARGVTRALSELEPEVRREFLVVVQSSIQEVIPFGMPVTYVVFDIAEQARAAVKILLSQIEGRESELQHYCDYRVLSKNEVRTLPGMDIPKGPSMLYSRY